MTRTFWQELVLGLVVIVLLGMFIKSSIVPGNGALDAFSTATKNTLASSDPTPQATTPYVVNGLEVLGNVTSTCVASNTTCTIIIQNASGTQVASYTTSCANVSVIVNSTAWYSCTTNIAGANTTITYRLTS